MKIKSLLLAAAAAVAFSASAQVTIPDAVILKAAPTADELIEAGDAGVELTILLNDVTLTNICRVVQFDIILSENLDFVAYNTAGTNFKKNGKRVNDTCDPDDEETKYALGQNKINDKQLRLLGQILADTGVQGDVDDPFAFFKVKVDAEAAKGKTETITLGGQVLATNTPYNGSSDFKPEDQVYAIEFPGDEPPFVGVADLNADKAIASVKYYNAAGVAADAAFDGVNIVVTKYVDGTQKVVKIVK